MSFEALRRNAGLKRALLLAGLAGVLFAYGDAAFAQKAGADKKEDEEASTGTVDEQTGKTLNAAIELLNADPPNYAGARAKMGELKMNRLSPYEKSRAEQILFNIAYQSENYDEARQHLQAAIDAGGLNATEVLNVRYQIAQSYMVQERWAEGIKALEAWFAATPAPNSSAYYLLAVAYYQTGDIKKALPNAEKAIALVDNPQESWMVLVLSLYLQQERFKDAIPLLERLIAQFPDKKTYWTQLSSVYGQLENYKKATATMQLAYTAGLLTDDSEFRRLSDLLLFSDAPYRGGVILEKAMNDGKVKEDQAAYEKLANCWIAAREWDKALSPLEKAASMSSKGDLYLRLGEVHAQRQNWDNAASALRRALDKGSLRDTAYAQLMLGISLYNLKRYDDAKPYFEKAASSNQHSGAAKGYLQLIEAQTEES